MFRTPHPNISQQPVFLAYLFGPAAYSLCRHEDQEQASISLKKCMPRSQELDKMIKCPYLESDGFSINMSPGWFLEKPSWQRSMTTATPPLLQHTFLCCPFDSSHVCFSGKASKKLSWATKRQPRGNCVATCSILCFVECRSSWNQFPIAYYNLVSLHVYPWWALLQCLVGRDRRAMRWMNQILFGSQPTAKEHPTTLCLCKLQWNHPNIPTK